MKDSLMTTVCWSHSLPALCPHKKVSDGYPGKCCRRAAVHRYAASTSLFEALRVSYDTICKTPRGANPFHSSLKTSLSAMGGTPSRIRCATVAVRRYANIMHGFFPISSSTYRQASLALWPPAPYISPYYNLPRAMIPTKS